MRAQPGVSCIIPFYNEGLRLFSILNVVTELDSVSQIICIDDGSTDDTSRLIKAKWPEIEVLRLEENEGKSQAVKHGLKLVKNEVILLLDADLQDINKIELENAILPMLLNPHIDMIILRRVNAAWFVKIDRADILLSGERIIKKKDLDEIFKNQVNGYQLEIAINTYMQQGNKNVQWTAWSARNTYKTKKCGLIYGIIKEIQMFISIFSYAGISNFFKQFTSFAKKELEVEPLRSTYIRQK
ncbi:MAG TPA: glycosyltransferase family 2 protein [Cytophagales bacterium]|nr:glycosyltransferase family 2 protein [Cytophagales bacterium]